MNKELILVPIIKLNEYSSNWNLLANENQKIPEFTFVNHPILVACTICQKSDMKKSRINI